MAWAVSPLEAEHPAAAAALVDLVVLALEARRLTAAAVEQATRALEQAIKRTGAADAPPAIGA